MWRKQADEKPAAAPEPAAAPAVPERPPAPPAPAQPRAEVTRITPAVTLKGEISGKEELYLDGEMEGSVRLPESRVTVGPHGRVAASIEADEIIVEGNVSGNLRARTRIELRRSAVVRGDMESQRLAILEGARVNGKIDMLRPGETRPARTSAAAAGGESLPRVSLGAKEPLQ